MTDDSLIAPLRDSIPIVAQNKKLTRLVATLTEENAHLRERIRQLEARARTDFDLDADSVPALLRRQV